MGLNQKQAVSVLYSISAAFGVVAVLIASNGRMKAMLFIIAFLAAGMISFFVYRSNKKRHEAQAREENCNDAKAECSEATACEDKNTDTDKK